MAKRGELRQVSNGVETSIALEAPRVTIGRGTNNLICLSDNGVSRFHAEIIRVGKDYIIRDLGSTNGTFVNDSRISEQLLNDGDVLRFGRNGLEFLFKVEGEEKHDSTAVRRRTTTEGLIEAVSEKLNAADHIGEVNARCLLAQAYLTKWDADAALAALAKYTDRAAIAWMPPSLQAMALYWTGRAHLERKHYEQAVALLRESLDLYSQAGDDSGTVEAQYLLAEALVGVRELLVARDNLHRALLTARRAGNSLLQAKAHILMGEIDWKEGDLEGARYNWSRSARLAENTNDELLQAGARFQQAFILYSEWKIKEAIPIFQSVIDQAEKIGNARFRLKAYNYLSRSLVRTGAWAAAERLFEDRLRLARDIGLAKAEALVLTDLAELRELQGDTAAARKALENALGLLGAMTMPRTQRILGRVLSACGQTLEAINEFEKGIRAAQEKGKLEEEVLLRLELAIACIEMSDAVRAQEQLGHIESSTALDPALGLMGRALYVRGLIHADGNQLVEANRSFAQALSIFNGIGDSYREAMTHAAIGELRSRMGRPESARAHLEQAKETFSRLGAAADSLRMDALLSSDIYDDVVPAMTRALSIAAPLSMSFWGTSQITVPAPPAPNRVLLAVGDENLASLLTKGLEAENYVIDHVQDGRAALEMVVSPHHSYELLILDSLLEYRSGLDVCRDLRRANLETPIIILGNRLDIEDKIEALQTGADDFINKKNLVFEELLAKIEALLR